MAETRVRYFDALRKAAKAVNSSLKLAEVLQTIATVTTHAIRVRGCSILLLDSDGQYLLHTASYGLSEEYLQKGAVSADLSAAEALRGRSVAISDVSGDPRVQYPHEASREGIASMLCAPLAVRGKVTGVIRIYSTKPGDFSQSATELLEAIADLSAIAIENARVYESVKEAHQTCLQELWQLQP